MKTWKKALIGVSIIGVLGLIAVIIAGYGVFNHLDETMKAQEPMLRQYVKLSDAEKNQFVLDHIDNDMYEFVKFIDTEEQLKKEMAAAREKIMSDPAAKQAALDWGRGYYAYCITVSDSISAELTPEERAKFEAESKDMDNRQERLNKELKRLNINIDK